MKKIVSIVLTLIMLLAFASCTNENENASSRLSETESISAASEKEDGKKSESSVSTVSRISSEKDKTNNQSASKTKSKQVLMAIKKSTNLQLGFLHFNTIFTKNYGESKESRLAEFEDVLRQGYVNTVFLADKEFGYFEESVKLCKKYDCSFWISPQMFYSENGDDIETYMMSVDSTVKKIIKLDAWDSFNGFYWIEPFLNFMTNDDFLLMTKSLYERYGKRNFPLLGPSQFIDRADSRAKDGKTAEKVKPSSLKFVTDAGWDNFSYDISRTNEQQNAAIKSNAEKWGASFTTVKDMYKYITNTLASKFDHNVNVWFFSGAFSTSLFTGGRIDETVASELLDFYTSYLNEQKYKGGIMLYSYLNNINSSSEFGLSYYLDVPSKQTGKQFMFQNAAKWKDYSKKLKDLKIKFDSATVFPAADVPFGSFFVLENEGGVIEYIPITDCKYSIDGGKTWSNTGYFEDLELDTEYTITVKNAKGQTKKFTVTTNYR